MYGEQALSSLLAFTNPWEIVLLLAGFVLVRVAVAPVAPSRRWRGYVLEFLDSGIIAVLLIFCIVRPFLLQAFLIPSGSMHPTLLEGDRIFVNKAVYFFREPRHGEVVVFHAPVWADPQRRDFIKRVIGLPGDRISVRDGKVFRNGVPLHEPYIAEPPGYTWPTFDYVVLKPRGQPLKLALNGEITVPKDHVLVFGDNRNESNDAHIWHAEGADGMEYPCPFVPRQNVIGKAILTFWPPGRVGIVR
ncbi:MAG: signal peptidase I [Armatimonadetes bacterium]|nr:signal peptidase I [Armatimonadota bacterium]